MARGARDRRGVQGHHRGVLRRCAEILVLQRLLGGRTAGDARGAALSRRFQRHHCGRARARLDGARGFGGTHCAAARTERGGAARSGAAAAAPRRRRRVVRPAGRREGRSPRKSETMHVRSGRTRMQGIRRRVLVPHHRASGDGANDLFGRGESKDQARDQRPRARQRAWMDGSWMDGVCSIDGPGTIPVSRLRRSELDHTEVQLGFRHRARRRPGQQHVERARSKSRAVHQTRRQADSVPRLERPANLAVRHDAVLRARGADARRTRQSARKLSTLHGARNGTLQRRRGPEHVRYGRRARAMGRDRRGAEVTCRHLSRGRHRAINRSRPLCPFPEVAVYTGTGSTDEGVNFACRLE